MPPASFAVISALDAGNAGLMSVHSFRMSSQSTVSSSQKGMKNMRLTRKITQISALLLIIALLASPIQAFSLNDLSSTETVISETAVEEAVLTAVSDWFSANYRPFYNLRNVDLRIIRRFTAREGTRYTVAVFC